MFVGDRRVNEALQTLRSHVPDSFISYRAGCSINGQVSKLETLRGAARYIRHLNALIARSDDQKRPRQQREQKKTFTV